VKSLKEAIRGDKVFKRTVAELRSLGRASVSGLWASACVLVASEAARALDSSCLVVTESAETALDCFDDARLFTGDEVLFAPQWEILPTDDEPPSADIFRRRMQAVDGLRRGLKGVFIAPIQSLLQPVPAPETLREHTLRIAPGVELPLELLRAWLVDRGFEEVFEADQPGTFGVHGGIVDIFPQNLQGPVRVELTGDTVETVRPINLATMRSGDPVAEAAAVAVPREEFWGKSAHGSRTLIDYVPEGALVVFIEPESCRREAENYLARLPSPVGLYTFDAVFRAPEGARRLDVRAFADGDAERFDTHIVEVTHPAASPTLGALETLAEAAERVIVACNTTAERDRFSELLLALSDAPRGRYELVVGRLSRGFRYSPKRIVLVAHHEIFHRYSQRRELRERPSGKPLTAFADLREGDYVVHAEHGIARFRGTRLLDSPSGLEEHLVLAFADGATLYVPVSRIDLVSKYIGPGARKPSLSRLRSSAWKNRVRDAERAVTDMAAELLALQVARRTKPGFAFGGDDEWQREMEESFIYEETEDQLRTLAEIKADMEKPYPMDRLICGDVGFGKTELAVRAAFKAALSAKQVAVLVPTTVLADQHLRTFRERLADFPVTVEMISRFRTRAETARILERLRDGSIDIIIGTHRLLQKDVAFKDLGLVIIDEEQRFGVAHKEVFKKLRATVDVLTMTATPIPRTLHMSLVGLRDISNLETPPVDRLAVHTEVTHYNETRIRYAVLRELARGGQVFFVHNRIGTIRTAAEKLARLVPEAKIAVAHGRMPEKELAETMREFVRGRYDILCATTIIESGLDIPNVNTLFVDRADRFGLADLHQLRGRVGRYKHRAYAYFLIDSRRPLTDVARRRLKAIEDYSQLGSGFKIALRDLEIRGSGNILGREQSGHIAAIGYDMYCRLLEAAVKRARGEPVPEPMIVSVQIGLGAYIPASYVNEPRARMELYRRFALAASEKELSELRGELTDRFGPPPKEAERLFRLHTLRIRAATAGIEAVSRIPEGLMIASKEPEDVARRMSAHGMTARIVDGAVHVPLQAKAAQPETIAARLLAALKASPQGAARRERTRKS